MVGQSRVVKQKLLYVVSNDWFFASHFLPMARAAVSAGLDVAVATHIDQHREIIQNVGVRLIPLRDMRRRRGLAAARETVSELVGVFAAERPDIVHLVSLKPVVLGAEAARRCGVTRCVYAITGLGFLGARGGVRSRFIFVALRTLFRRRFDGPLAHYLFENAEDAQVFAPWLAQPRRTILPGAGVDLNVYMPRPMPAPTPFRVAMASRMLWQKGIDIAVAAVQLARESNPAIELELYGAPDFNNPDAIGEEQLVAWSSLPGVTWRGATREVAEIWGNFHACIFPSRGGEGLPRTLLEAGACGRAILTSDVPGCRDLVRNGIDGIIAPRNDVRAFADAILDLADNLARCAAMGKSVRRRVAAAYSEGRVEAELLEIYGRLLKG